MRTAKACGERDREAAERGLQGANVLVAPEAPSSATTLLRAGQLTANPPDSGADAHR
jgi:hypothetical protein